MDDSSDDVILLNGWKKEEKFQLLQALSEYGTSDIDQIQNFISTKSKEEIEKAIQYYSMKALQHPAVLNKQSKRVRESPLIPIASWAKLLTDAKSFEDLRTEIAVALRLIAEFEDQPPIAHTNKIDFRSAYYLLANALEGKPLPSDKCIKAIFEKCIVDVASKSKTFINPFLLKNIINGIHIGDDEMKINTQISSSNEILNMRYLASQSQYNPLNILEDYLTPSNSYEII